MLNELSIKNFAIIDELHVTFGEGLNVLSGETGAGKSIIIGAVSLLLGDRATSEMIRTQADTATVEAVFDISADKPLRDKIDAMGFPVSDELIIRRIISHTGKNKVFINGQAATLANLAAVSERLINICGQHEHQIILAAENHIDILDEFGGCLSERAVYTEHFNQYQQIRSGIEKLEELSKSADARTELYEFQLKEIQDINPQPNEDTVLSDEKKVLVNIQRLSEWAGNAFDLLYGDKNSVIVMLKEVQRQIKEIKKIDAGLKISEAEMENNFVALQEAALLLRDYGKGLFFDAERLAAIEERLDLIHRLKRKYGGSLEAVFQKKQDMEEALRKVSSLDEELQKMIREEEAVKSRLRQSARNLSESRKKAAKTLEDKVGKEIRALNMPHASFFVHFKNRADDNTDFFGPRGADDIEFDLSANKGEDARPLNKVASGGELSRIILALKNVLSGTGSVLSMVFDEVDNGIGGAVAEIVGRKLRAVSANHQVICITHLPQIACFGDKHMFVSKKVVKGRTLTFVNELDSEQKIEEISRMLGGVDVTPTTREHAREMLQNAGSHNLKVSGGDTC
ncbi:MAG TPA: DNA repair protein RecN [Smithella sp.]|nr:DNA repair protein RecN [Smithella sp.]